MSCKRTIDSAYIEQSQPTGAESDALTIREPQNTMSSCQASQPPDPVMQKPIVQLSFQILHRLIPNRAQAHLDRASRNEYGIECGQLDLSNGGGFLQLNTPEEMQQLASQYGFNNLEDMETDPEHPFSNSVFVADHLYSHLVAFKQDKCLADQTKWDLGM